MRNTAYIAAGIIAGIVITASALDSVRAAVPTSRTAPRAATTATQAIERGRYLVFVGGCNDCHTPGFGESGGTIPESEWLVGSPMGFKGPWGTSYPINLRTFINGLTEREWISQARTLKGAPPMPWWALHSMKEEDLRAIYAFVKHLGPKGETMPGLMPPHVEPKPPYLIFQPVLPG